MIVLFVCGFYWYEQTLVFWESVLSTKIALYFAGEMRPLSLIAMCQSNLSGALSSQQSTALHSVPWNCAPMPLQDCICSRSLWLSPHQLTKPHLLSYPVVIYSSHLWSSMMAIYASRLAAYQDIIVDDDPELPFNIQHYSQVHEKSQVDLFEIPSCLKTVG